jgi:hypothetical protein
MASFVCTNLIAAASCDRPSEVSAYWEDTPEGASTNKAKIEYRDCTRFPQGAQPHDVMENKGSTALDNRTDKAHSRTITGHNAQHTGAGGRETGRALACE